METSAASSQLRRPRDTFGAEPLKLEKKPTKGSARTEAREAKRPRHAVGVPRARRGGLGAARAGHRQMFMVYFRIPSKPAGQHGTFPDGDPDHLHDFLRPFL